MWICDHNLFPLTGTQTYWVHPFNMVSAMGLAMQNAPCAESHGWINEPNEWTKTNSKNQTRNIPLDCGFQMD